MEEHLFVCEQCQETLKGVDGDIRLIKFATAEWLHAPAENKLRRLWRTVWPEATLPRLAWATTAAVILIAAVLYFNPLPQGPPVAITLVSLRGGLDSSRAHVPAHRALDLTLDAPELSPSASMRVEVVDGSGKQVWSGHAKMVDGKPKALMPKGLSKGLYWVRLYEGADLAREYGLRAD